MSANQMTCDDCSVSKQACADPTTPEDCNGNEVPNDTFTMCIPCPAGFSCDG